MSDVTWGEAIRRVAGVASLAGQPDAQAAARDAISEVLRDWDVRRDWRYTQVVAPDINIAGGDTDFALPTTFKKPYVAYLNTGRTPLYYVERANWHRVFPGLSQGSQYRYYTLFNEASTGRGQLFPTAQAADTLTLLYYKAIIYEDADGSPLDIPDRWTGYILDGARYKLALAKGALGKANEYRAIWQDGIKKAKEDDLRIPDQFLSFAPPEAMSPSPYWNPNSTWESQWSTP